MKTIKIYAVDLIFRFIILNKFKIMIIRVNF